MIGPVVQCGAGAGGDVGVKRQGEPGHDEGGDAEFFIGTEPGGHDRRGEAGQKAHDQAGQEADVTRALQVQLAQFLELAEAVQVRHCRQEHGVQRRGDLAGHDRQLFAQIEQAGGAHPDERAGDHLFDGIENHAQHAGNLHHAAEAVKQGQQFAIKMARAEGQAGQHLEAGAGAQPGGEQVADDEGPQQRVHPQPGQQQSDDQRGLQQETHHPDAGLPHHQLQAPQHVAERAEAQVEHHGGGGGENQDGGGFAQLRGDVEGVQQHRHPQTQQRQQAHTQRNGDGEAGSQQAIDRFGVVASMVFGGIADVDVGDTEGAHAQVADDDEADGPDAVLLQTDVAEDDRWQSDPAEHVEQLGSQLHDGVLG